MRNHIVFDTNALVSAALIKNSVSALALNKALQIGILAISAPILAEFSEVIFRSKFNKYLDNNSKFDFLDRVERYTAIFDINETIRCCRDPKDDKYLELAVSCNASQIITGDKDLLVLHPFRAIDIITASDFLKPFDNKFLLSEPEVEYKEKRYY